MMSEERIYLMANGLVSHWMEEYKAYLLDGDPRVLHPRAKAALVLVFSEAISAAQNPLDEEGNPVAKARKSRVRKASDAMSR